MAAERNFSSISPSAKMLVLMKGLTDIPFARRAAELVSYPEKYIPEYSRRELTFWARTLHFEIRYKSIDQLLQGLPVKNILEFSSGFSFRCLETAKQKGVYYIDTDLSELIATKKEIVNTLIKETGKIEGTLELLPLNVFDEAQFREIVNHFPAGEIILVNEGLLMYLDMIEKERLCKIIHGILKERGGYWITADIYSKDSIEKLHLNLDDKLQQFLNEHHVAENRFENFAQAEDLFRGTGFVVDKIADVPRSKLSTLKYLIKSASLWQLFKMRKAGKVQATWRLKCK